MFKPLVNTRATLRQNSRDETNYTPPAAEPEQIEMNFVAPTEPVPPKANPAQLLINSINIMRGVGQVRLVAVS